MHCTCTFMDGWCELSFDRTLFEWWLVRIHSHMWSGDVGERKKENIYMFDINALLPSWTCGMMKNESSHSLTHLLLLNAAENEFSPLNCSLQHHLLSNIVRIYAWWILWLAKIKVFYKSSLFSQVIAFTSLFAHISPSFFLFFLRKKRVPKILLISQALNYVIDFIRVPGILMELCLFADFYVTCPPEAGRRSVKKINFTIEMEMFVIH